MTGDRPTGVTVLATLGFIGGILTILGGLVTVVTGPRLEPYGMGYGTMMAGMGVSMIITGIVTLAVAWGLWTSKSWAWWLEVIFAGLSVLSILMMNIVGAVIGAVILWYFFKPHVKEYFGVKVDFST